MDVVELFLFGVVGVFIFVIFKARGWLDWLLV